MRRRNVIVSTFLPGAESDIVRDSRWRHVKSGRPAVVLGVLGNGDVMWRYQDRRTAPNKGGGGWACNQPNDPGSRQAAWVLFTPARFLELFKRYAGSEVRRLVKA